MFKRLILVVLLVFVFVVPTQTNDDPMVQIEEMLNNLANRDTFSGSVLIVQDGEFLLHKGYGLAIREWELAATADTRYYIADLTIQFTAQSILMLHEQGVLNINDSICQYLEDCPETWADVTIYNLLIMTGGIREYVGPNAIPHDIELTRPRRDDLLEALGEQSLINAPGDGFYASMANYFILGYILENASGTKYKKFMTENLFEPIGLQNTGVIADTYLIDKLAQGYRNARHRANYVHMMNFCGAADLYSTVEDYYLWLQGLLNYELISQETWDMMWDTMNDFGDWQCGYGICMNIPLNTYEIGSVGFGYRTVMRHYIEENITIVIFSNRDDFNIHTTLDSVGNMLVEN